MSAPSTAPSLATSNATVVSPANAHDLTAKHSASHAYDDILSRSSNESDKTLVVREVTQGIVTFSTPFSRGGVPIGGRSTAIRHSSGSVFLYVSHPHTPATAEVIAGLGGEVKWLVTPDGEHGINFKEYAGAYPNAQTIGVPRYKDKLPDIKWTGLFGAGGETQQYGFEDEISIHRVSAHLNDELVVVHAPSGTLIEADMLFNLPPTEQYSRAGGIPALMKLMGGGSTMAPGGYGHGLMASSISKDKVLLKKELAPILALKWDRIIPCHGDVIETGGRVAWDQVWGKFTS